MSLSSHVKPKVSNLNLLIAIKRITIMLTLHITNISDTNNLHKLHSVCQALNKKECLDHPLIEAFSPTGREWDCSLSGSTTLPNRYPSSNTRTHDLQSCMYYQLKRNTTTGFASNDRMRYPRNFDL